MESALDERREEGLAHEDLETTGDPPGQHDERVVRTAAGFRSVAPAQHLLALDPKGLGEPVPGETARMLQPVEALGEARSAAESRSATNSRDTRR